MTHYRDSPQITHALVGEMGALGDPQYFWWKDVTVEHLGSDDGVAPKDWRLRVVSLNPDDPDYGDGTGKFPPFETEITHEVVAEAVTGILAGKFSDSDKLPEERNAVNVATVNRCRELVDDPENGYLSWDPWVADELLQVIVYGGIIW